MARTLVENLADKWDPSQYTDEYRANLMKIIKAKMKGKEAHLETAEEPRQAEVVALMERLRQSLQGAGGASRRRAGAKPVKKPAARRKPFALPPNAPFWQAASAQSRWTSCRSDPQHRRSRRAQEPFGARTRILWWARSCS